MMRMVVDVKERVRRALVILVCHKRVSLSQARTRSFQSQNEATEGSCGRKIHGKILKITQLILRAPGLWIVAIDEKPE